MKNQYDDSFAFGKRYLVIGILMYILAVFIALNFKDITMIKPNAYIIYSLLFIGVLLTAFLILYFVFRKNRYVASLISGSVILIIIFILGFSRTYFFYHTCIENRNLISTHREVCGIVRDEPSVSNSEKSYSITLDVYSAVSEDATIDFKNSPIIRLYISKDDLPSPPKVGDSMRFIIKTDFSREVAFDGGFDYNRKLLQEKIVYCGNSKEAYFTDPPPRKNGFIASLKNLGMTVRKYVIKCSDLYDYADDEKNLLSGILVGHTDDFSDELYAKYSKSGFIHITSVSGMHTSFLLVAITTLLGLFRFPKRGVCIIAIPLMIVFSSIALFTPSVLRAVIMISVLLLSSVFRRSNDSITALSIAALLLVIHNPFTLESCSALLSFSATLGILVYYPLLRQRLTSSVFKKRKYFRRTSLSIWILKAVPASVRKFIINSMALSIAAIIGISYFLAYFYGKFQYGGILGNILISLPTAGAFIFGYLNCIVGLVSDELAFYIGKLIVNPCLFAVNKVNDFFAAANLSISVPSPSKAFFVVYIVICCGLYILLKPSEDKKETTEK